MKGLLVPCVLLLLAPTIVIVGAQNGTATNNNNSGGACEYGAWSAFSICGVQGDECLKTRTRMPIAGAQTNCTEQVDYRACDNQECADEWCSLGEWSAWSPCSVTCGHGGVQVRYRSILSVPNITCPHLQDSVLQDSRPCAFVECPRPEMAVEDGNLFLTVPEGNTIYFKEGDTITSIDSLRNEIASAVESLGEEQADALQDVREFAEGQLDLIRASIDEKAEQTLGDAKAYTTQVTSELNTNLTASLTTVDTHVDSVRAELLREIALLEDLVASNLTIIDDRHSSNHADQSSVLEDVLTTLSDVQNDVAGLVDTKADKADTAASISALRDDHAARIDALNQRLDDLYAILLPSKMDKPSADDVARTSVKLSWTAATSPTPILSYTVYFTAKGGDEQHVDIAGDQTSITLSDLTPETEYAISVGSRNGIGKGPRSDTLTLTTKAFVTARHYFCEPSAWEHHVTTVPSTACSAEFTVPGPAIIHASFTGHAYCSSAWIYGAISVNNDVPNPGSHQSHAPAHSYSTTWETFGTDRVVSVNPGNVKVELRVRAGHGCQLNGAAMHIVAITGLQSGADKSFACHPAGWSQSIGNQQSNWRPCTASIHTPYPSSLFAFYTGHVVNEYAWMYGAVAIDNTPSGSDIGTQRYAPAHSYTLRYDWASFRTFRTEHVDAGNHGVSITAWRGSGGTGWLNGLGLMGFYVHHDDGNSGVFRCSPTAWSYRSTGNVVTPCTTVVTLRHKSVLFGSFTGHAKITSGTCYGTVTVNGDATGPLEQYGGALQRFAPAHTYTTNWETFQNGRALVLEAGSFNVGFSFRCVDNGELNGAGLQGYFIRYA